jgi:hypothetical protein
MPPVLRFLTTFIAGFVGNQVKDGLTPVAPYLRKLALGTVLILVSVGFWLMGVLFLAVSLFFALSTLDAYVQAALWSLAACWGIALVILLTGVSMVRKPR